MLGVLAGWDDSGPLVDYEGNLRGPVRARTMGSVSQPRRSATAAPLEVVLLVERNRRRAPVLLGALNPLAADGRSVELEARVDGQRVELEGRDEIVLRCGEASITLRRNGRITIRGAQVETRASGLNRIKGGSVAIN